jgi:hypothetical protein
MRLLTIPLPLLATWIPGCVIARGKSTGRSIYEIIEQWAVEGEALEIRLAVLEVSETAERFSRSLGYRELKRVGPDSFKSRGHHRVGLCRLVASDPAALLNR